MVVSERAVSTDFTGQQAATLVGDSLDLDFRASMRQLAGAVSIVTTGEGTDICGFTATSVTSLSVDPPSLLVCVNKSSTAWPTFKTYGHFAVNILGSEHRDMANVFAGRTGIRGADRFSREQWHCASGRAPIFADAPAVVECELDEVMERFSHAILIGRVLGVRLQRPGEPLIYWQSGYRDIFNSGHS